MATVILVRHGRSTANAAGILAGRSVGIELDPQGREQAATTAGRLAVLPLVEVVSSPMERCRQTARIIADAQTGAPRESTEERITECDYGDWAGRTIQELYREPLWPTVLSKPSAVVFPGGESMPEMQRRAVEAIREHDARVESEHGADAVWVAVSHGDIIKSVLADALGMELDRFQRIQVSPASVSIVRYGGDRPRVLATNSYSGDLASLTPARS